MSEPNEPTPEWRQAIEMWSWARRHAGFNDSTRADLWKAGDALVRALDAATARAAEAEEALAAANERAQDAWDQEATANDLLTTLRAHIANLEAQAKARGGETVGADELAWRVCRVIKGQCQRCPAEEMMGGEMCKRSCRLQVEEAVNTVQTGNPWRKANSNWSSKDPGHE